MKFPTWFLCLAVGAASPAFAQSDDARLNQRVWVQLGAFHPEIKSYVQADRSGQQGTEISFENDLALKRRETLPTLLLGARIADNWRAEFEYFKLRRTARQNVISGTIVFDDTTYTGSADLESEFDSTVYRLSGGYSFFRTPETEAGVSLGLHLTDFTIALTGIGTINGGGTAVRTERKEQKVPLPTLGVYATHAFSSTWAAGGRVDFLSLKHGDYDGRLLNIQATLYYRFNPNLALGVGYRHDDYKLKVQRSDDWEGKVEYRFSGPQLVLDAGF